LKFKGAAPLAILAMTLALVMLATPVMATGYAVWHDQDSEDTSATHFDDMVGVPPSIWEIYGPAMQTVGTYSFVQGPDNILGAHFHVTGAGLGSFSLQASYEVCRFNGTQIDRHAVSGISPMYGGGYYAFRFELAPDQWMENLTIQNYGGLQGMEGKIIWKAQHLHNSLHLAAVEWIGDTQQMWTMPDPEIGRATYPDIGHDIEYFKLYYERDLDWIEDLTDYEKVRASIYSWANVIGLSAMDSFTWFNDRITGVNAQPYENATARYYSEALDATVAALEAVEALTQDCQAMNGSAGQLLAKADSLWKVFQAASYFDLAALVSQAQYQHQGEQNAAMREELRQQAHGYETYGIALLAAAEGSGNTPDLIGAIIGSMAVSGAFLVIGGIVFIIGLAFRRPVVILVGIAGMAATIMVWAGLF